MIINHNISALNSNRMFSNNVQRMEKKLNNLSTGQRINQGSDDPAGLAVSEKMRGQIRGLNQASRNIQDASSLVQTTEGFLKESNDVLHRMRELAVQGANGTYTQDDRVQIMVEMDESVKELNRIHEDAKFNTLRLLDNTSLKANSFGSVDAQPRNANFAENGLVVQSGANTDERMYVRIEEFNTYGLGLTGQAEGNYEANQNLAWREQSIYTSTPKVVDNGMYLEKAITAPANENVHVDSLAPKDGNRVDITTTEKATETITVIDVALNKVNRQRADLGAFQNRLEFANQGVENAAENLQASESRIRDADMAKEFVEFTKEQILSQSAASMTSQANMRSQLVMRVLG